jgi:hypothetical protein
MASQSPRFPWIAASAVAAFAVVVAVVGIQVPAGGDGFAEQGARLPLLGLAQVKASLSADLVAEQIAAYDPTPMFIPSAMNNSDPALPADAWLGAAGPFEDLSPALVKTGPLRFPAPVPLPVSPVAGLHLTERAEAPLALARMDTAGEGLAVRAARIEVANVDDEGTALVLELVSPVSIPQGDWQPFELMGAISRSGQVGELVITTSSGADEIDEFFRSHLKENLRVGARVKAGFYVFHVGP